ncbi:MAG: hypothetical protein HY670_10590 [Chloroflexi bacterium]|nr:hypothetical protein [Chloroflexota bacterium]
MPERVELLQADIEVEGHRFTVTAIPTATSGSWYTVQDACEVWGAVAIGLDGTVVGWRSPPDEKYRLQLEEAIKRAFGLPEV